VSDSAPPVRVPFGDLRREQVDCGADVRAAVERVLESGWFVLGREVEAFEAEFAAYLGTEHVIGVASGTEAIQLALQTAGVGQGDYVLTVPNTAVPTASAITAAGATPLFVDVDARSLTMDPEQLREVASREKARLGDRLKAVVPVHLYGQTADMRPILDVAGEFELTVVEDAAQAHGATYGGRRAGTLGRFGAFSFYPSKNLGCYGDGGAVVARSAADADELRMRRNYGQSCRYYHSVKGVNSRLDEIQAAVLRAKVPFLDAWNRRRAEISRRYTELLTAPGLRKPEERSYGTHAWHLYTVRRPDRDELLGRLTAAGVQTLIHYPVPIHLQEAYSDLGLARGSFPVAERAADEILSLPLFPHLREDEIDYVVGCVDDCRA
jgi:dTDP-4-amino-4,6-dideoxygalactose transaminase